MKDVALQMTYPGTRISTLEEVFEFAKCADPARQILWNVESKINPEHHDRTLGVNDFVRRQHEVFTISGYKDSVTVSFDSFMLSFRSSSFTWPPSTRVLTGAR